MKTLIIGLAVGSLVGFLAGLSASSVLHPELGDEAVAAAGGQIANELADYAGGASGSSAQRSQPRRQLVSAQTRLFTDDGDSEQDRWGFSIHPGNAFRPAFCVQV